MKAAELFIISIMDVGIIKKREDQHDYLQFFLCFAAQGDSFTTEFYANPVAIADFEKHCAQRRKYPVLLQIEFNNATREDELQVSIKCVVVLAAKWHAALIGFL